jgi:hypothetical protein
MKAINLDEYADRYKLGWDEARQIPGQTREDIAWLRRISGKYGQIFPWSETRLAAYVEGTQKSKQAERLAFVTVEQGGGSKCPEVVVSFSPEHLDKMAKVVRARRRRRLSAEHRKKLVSAGASHRFSGRTGPAGSSASQSALEEVEIALTSTCGDLRPPDSASSASEPWPERSTP